MMTKKNAWAEARLVDIDADEVGVMIKESNRSHQKLKKDFRE